MGLVSFCSSHSLPLLSATEREIAYFRGSRLDCTFLPLLSMPVTGSPLPPVRCLSFVMPFPGKYQKDFVCELWREEIPIRFLGWILKVIYLVFLKQEYVFVLVRIGLKKFWKVRHETENKNDPLGQSRVAGGHDKREVFHRILIDAGIWTIWIIPINKN